jgi:hypothetical protein
VTFTSPTQASIGWKDNSDDEENFELQRSPDGASNWATVSSTIPANQISYTFVDNALVCGTPVYFRVRATRTNFNPSASAWSSIISGQYNCSSLIPDSFEQNDTPGTAKLVVPPVDNSTLNILPANDPDYYTFFGTPGTYSLAVFSSVGLALDLTLTAPDGSTIIGQQTGSLSPAFSGNLPSSGFYIISVVPSNVTTTVAMYRMVLTTAPFATATPTPTITPLPTTIGPDRFEPNDTDQTAKQINPVFQDATLTISPAGNVDYYYFVGVPGPATLSAFSSFGMNLTMSLTGPSGTIVAANNGTPNPSINTTLTINGFYIIRVAAAAGPNLGYYQLNL